LAPKPQVTTAVPKAKVAPSKPPSTLATTPRSAPVKAAVPTATASAAKSASEALGGKEKGKERVEKRQGRKLEKPLMHTTLFDPSTESDAASAPAKTVKVISAVSSSSKRKRKDSETVFSLGIPSELPIDERLAKHLEVNMGIAKLTEVQKQAIPILLKRKDLQVNSATGTGKTLAYAIPLVQDLQQISPKIKRADGA
jgi:ATP-dependent RNA helicase DDX31/DBP7